MAPDRRGQEEIVEFIAAIPLIVIMFAVVYMVYLALYGGDVSAVSQWISGFIVDLVVLCVFLAIVSTIILALVKQ